MKTFIFPKSVVVRGIKLPVKIKHSTIFIGESFSTLPKTVDLHKSRFTNTEYEQIQKSFNNLIEIEDLRLYQPKFSPGDRIKVDLNCEHFEDIPKSQICNTGKISFCYTHDENIFIAEEGEEEYSIIFDNGSEKCWIEECYIQREPESLHSKYLRIKNLLKEIYRIMKLP